jgi:hypothetical protein
MKVSKLGLGAALVAAGLIGGAAFGPVLSDATIPAGEQVVLSGCGQSASGTGTVTGVNVSMTRDSGTQTIFTLSSGSQAVWVGVLPPNVHQTIDVPFENGLALSNGVSISVDHLPGVVCRVYGDGFAPSTGRR